MFTLAAYTTMDAHPLTLVVIVAAMLVVPFYLLATYVFGGVSSGAFSGASAKTGALLGALFLVFGAVMAWVCLSRTPANIGPIGQLIVPTAWVVPTLLLFVFRRSLVPRPLGQRWLVGLQVWRAIGGVFLIEMSRGHIPGVFAWPAGVGDLLVAAVAAGLLLVYRGRPIPRSGIVAVIVLGMADFAGAFFFGFTSSTGPWQLFPTESPSQLLWFPTGMIPMFLVPAAIFFHGLSWLSLRQGRIAE